MNNHMKAGDTATAPCTCIFENSLEFMQSNFAFGLQYALLENISRSLKGWMEGSQELFKDSTQTSRSLQDCVSPVRIR